ncbi:MAG TPA: hypothetical protein VK118_00120 [Tetragenococcus sp.]|nr:hypothetical protein [Tetragenococcus sp.]
MNRRIKKKKAYRKYIQDIFAGYETMLLDEKLQSLTFTYAKEETILRRDKENKIHFLSRDKKW